VLGNIRDADRTISITYPAILEPKLLLVCVQYAHAAAVALGRVVPTKKTRISQTVAITRLIAWCKKKRKSQHAKAVQQLDTLVTIKKTCAVEFSRRGKYVLAPADYKLVTITPALARTYVDTIKELVTLASNDILK